VAQDDPALATILATLGAQGGEPLPMLELVLSSVGDGVAICNHDGSSLYFNSAAKQILGLGKDTPLDIRAHGASLYYLHEFSALPEDELPLVRALRGEDTSELELFARGPGLPDGAVIAVNARPIRGRDGHVVGAIAILGDVGARKRAEEELRSANAKLGEWVAELERRAQVTLLMNEMAELLQSCRTMDEFSLVVSRFASRIFEREQGAVFVVSSSRSALELVTQWGGVQVPDRVFPPHGCWALRRGRIHRSGGPSLGPECEHADAKSGGEYTCIPMMGQGEALGILHIGRTSPGLAGASELSALVEESRLRTTIAVAEHVALALANLKLRETLRMQAIRDPLTGLFNRRHMEESLERELVRAERSQTSVSAVMIDIDHFKRFNDTFGHAAADFALRNTCDLIRTSIRADDIACRYGGEELVVILPDTSQREAIERAEILRAAVAAQQLRFNGIGLGAITASFGVATSPAQGTSSELLLRAADEGLYEAKRRGRNQVCVKQSDSRLQGDPAPEGRGTFTSERANASSGAVEA
jgi:diguanylate cyclase (GGDEF)-like protein/PAS domain S-box-containing protein